MNLLFGEEFRPARNDYFPTGEDCRPDTGDELVEEEFRAADVLLGNEFRPAREDY